MIDIISKYQLYDHNTGVLMTGTDKNTQQGLMTRGIEPVAISIIIPMRGNFHV